MIIADLSILEHLLNVGIPAHELNFNETLEDFDDVFVFPKGRIAYSFMRNQYMFEHEETPRTFMSAEYFHQLSELGVLKSSLEAWLHGVPWEDILA